MLPRKNWYIFTTNIIHAVSNLFISFITVVLIAVAPPLLADTISKETYQVIRKGLVKAFPEEKVKNLSLHPTPLPGIFEADMGELHFYIDETGRYLFESDIYDIATKRKTTTHAARKKIVKSLQNYGTENMVTYSAKRSKHTIFVVTDYTCPYCVKFHRNIDAILKNNISVNYILYARNGLSSRAAVQMESLFCHAVNKRRNYFNKLIDKKKISPTECDGKRMQRADRFAKEVGLTGTPMLITDDGRMVSGYLDHHQVKDLFR